MTSFQCHLDSKFADMHFSTNACVFYLADPLTLPSQDYEWLVAVPHATIPLSHWVIDESNNLLELVYSDKSRYISLPLGNRSVDEIVVYLNDRLLHGYTAAYDEAINRIVFSSEVLGESLAIGEMSTCGRLLGVKAGDAAVDGVLIPPRGVDLAGTSSMFIRSNLSTRNRDPVSKATSNILAKVHVSQNFHEIEYHSSSLKFPIADRNVSLIIIYLTDDFQRHMDFHAADFSLTIEFTLRAHADNAGRIDVFGTLRSPMGPLFDLGEPSNPWREVYAEGLTLSDTSNMKFTHFQGAEGDFNLDDVIEYAVSLVVPADHPTTVSLERINEVSFNNGIVVKGDLIPYEENAGFPPLSRVGNLTYPFLEGHFANLFAGNIYGLDEGGSTRRVLLEGDAAATPQWITDLQSDVNISGFNFDVDFTGPRGPAGADGADGADAVLPPWVASSQSAIPLSGFANDLVLTADSVAWENVLNKPTLFSGSYNDLANTPTIPTIPSWVATSQSAIPLSGFANDLALTADNVEWAAVLNKPALFSGSYVDLTNKPTIPTIPSWVATSQSAIPLSGFANDLALTADSVEWSDVLNKPTFFSGSYNDLTNTPTIPSLVGYATEAWVSSQDFGADVDWASLSGRPLWTDKFIYTQNVGPQMYPTASENYDIVLLDSITPTTNDVYNLGQDGLRWKFVYAMSGRFATDIHVGEITNHARFTYSTASNLVSVSRPLLLPRSPEVSNEAATKGYVDTAVAGGGNHDHPEYEPAKFMKVEDDIKIGNDIRFVDSSGNDVCRLKYHPDGCEVDGHMFPDGTREFDLGKAGDEWRDIYAQFATISGGASIGSLETPLLNVTGVMSLNGNKITQVGAPDTGTDVVNKSYVDTEIANVTIDWDSISGETKPAIFKDEVGYNISSETFIPALNYVYDLGTTGSRWGTLHAYGVNAYLSPINAFEGVDAKGKAIVDVAAPTDSADAANKAYVDAEVLNVQIRASLALGMRGFAHIRVDKLSETETNMST
eukprot:jgi/Tetstr1/455602/TSEL_042414.t1